MSPFNSALDQEEFIISHKYKPKFSGEEPPKFNREFISGSPRNKKP